MPGQPDQDRTCHNSRTPIRRDNEKSAAWQSFRKESWIGVLPEQ